jgi:hypothetical protein
MSVDVGVIDCGLIAAKKFNLKKLCVVNVIDLCSSLLFQQHNNTTA